MLQFSTSFKLQTSFKLHKQTPISDDPLPVGSEVRVGDREPVEVETPELWYSSSYDGTTVDHRALLANQEPWRGEGERMYEQSRQTYCTCHTSRHTEEDSCCLGYQGAQSRHMGNFDPIEVALDFWDSTASCNRLWGEGSR